METSLTNRRCLVTGGAGFLGSHVCEALLARGARVTVLDDLSAGRRANLEDIGEDRRFGFVHGSALDGDLVEELVGEADLVLHLAAVVGVRRVWDAPEETLRHNVRSTQIVLNAAARHGVRTLFSSSSEVYGKGPGAPLREDGPLLVGATDSRRWSYAFSKACGEWLAGAHARTQGLEALSVRLFNVVGPRQSPDGGMVLPRFVRQALAGDPITVYGDGSQTRSFVHARDAARAIVRLVSPGGPPDGVFNVGGPREVTVLELAERVRHAVGKAVGKSVSIARMPYREAFGLGFDEPRRRRPDLTRLEQAIGFAPRITLEETVAELVHEGQRLAQVTGC